MTIFGNTGELDPSIQALYDARYVNRKADKLVYSNFAMRATIKKNGNTATAFCYKYLNLQPVKTTLPEFDGSNRIQPTQIKRVKITYSAEPRGAFTTVNDVINVLDLDNVENSYTAVLSDQAGLTADYVCQEALEASSQVLFADDKTDPASVAEGALITEEDIDFMEIHFKNQGIEHITGLNYGSNKTDGKAVEARYVLMCNPAVAMQISKLDGYVAGKHYEGKLPLEKGSIGEFAILSNPLVGFQMVDGKRVYSSYAFGKDCFTDVTLEGETKGGIIIKPLGSGGSSDPLNQVGTIGWKDWMGADITDSSGVFKVLSTVEVDSTAPRMQYSS